MAASERATIRRWLSWGDRAEGHERMITLHGFKSIFEGGVGETKDLRVQWALEESGLPYRVHGLDQLAGDLQSEAYGEISPFHQVPVIDDDGFSLSESGAIVLYIAEKAGKLIPSDIQGRTRVSQWCFAAVATIESTFMSLDLVGIFDPNNHELERQVRTLAHRWLEDLERRLADRTWIACADFTMTSDRPWGGSPACARWNRPRSARFESPAGRGSNSGWAWPPAGSCTRPRMSPRRCASSPARARSTGREIASGRRRWDR
jgi:glutathione S-transferase